MTAVPQPCTPEPGTSRWQSLKRRLGTVCAQAGEERSLQSAVAEKKDGRARAFQFGNTVGSLVSCPRFKAYIVLFFSQVVIEDESGGVLKTYELQRPKSENRGLKRTHDRVGWFQGNSFTNDNSQKQSKKTADEKDTNGMQVRFTIDQQGRRMTERDFILEMQNMDPRTRRQVVAQSSTLQRGKAMARRDAASPGQEVSGEIQSGEGIQYADGPCQGNQRCDDRRMV